LQIQRKRDTNQEIEIKDCIEKLKYKKSLSLLELSTALCPWLLEKIDFR